VSYDLAAFSRVDPLAPDRVADVYVALAKGDDWSKYLVADPRIGEFVKELTTRWPQIDDVQEEQLDDCPWSVAFHITPAYVVCSMVYSRVEEVVPVCVEMATGHRLDVFDPQTSLLHSPDQPAREVPVRPREQPICANCGLAIEGTAVWSMSTKTFRHPYHV
jgi:hypothetical protein